MRSRFKELILCAVCWRFWCGVIFVTSFENELDSSRNSSLTLTQILKTYDIRLRPNFGGQPLYIGIELIISNVEEFSEVNMDYTITITLNQYWKDERLAFSSDDIMLPLAGDFAEKIWVPDTFLANDKNSFLHEVTEKNKMIRLYGDGSIAYGMRFTTTLICPMNLVSYPLDSQNCTVEIESYGYTTRDLYFYWKTVAGITEIDMHQYVIPDYNLNDRLVELETGTYQRLSLSILFRRNIGSFIFQMYLPSVLIVMISWISFWINFDAPAARVALGITTILTLLITHNNVRSTLPKISYVKAIDIYLVTCFIFVFAALIEYAAVNYIYWEYVGKMAKVQKTKRPSLWKKSKVWASKRKLRLKEAAEQSAKSVSPIVFRRKSKSKKRDAQETVITSSTATPTGDQAAGTSTKPSAVGVLMIPQITCSPDQEGESSSTLPVQAGQQLELEAKNLLSTKISPSQITRASKQPPTLQVEVDKDEHLLTPVKLTRSSSFCGATGIHELPRPDPFSLPKSSRSPSIVLNRRRRFVQSIRHTARAIEKKLPPFTENVNHIDNLARIVFPVSFLLFNAIYWPYYVLNSDS